MQIFRYFPAVCYLTTIMPIAAGQSAAESPSPEDEAIIDALASYNVDAHQLVDVSDLPPTTSPGSAALACGAISEIFRKQLLQRNATEYAEWRGQFWSQQQSDVRPACIFQPTDSAQVAIALLLARLTRCLFAVKSGGHAAFTGASSVPDGLAIDLNGLNSTDLSPDKKYTKVGAGNRWIDVYNSLVPEGLIAIGGRVSDIGVGGLTLGGGISFYSAEYGFACDNVNNYEIVIADGRILQVNPQSHPDLYWALRGGGNNFGIVTRFDLAVYPAGNLWAGTRVYSLDNKKALLDAVVKFGDDWPSDPKAALILSFAYILELEKSVAIANLEYTEPKEEPAIFDSFRAIANISGSMDIKNLSEVSLEFERNNPSGKRENYWTATVKLDIDILTFVVDTYLAGVDPIKKLAGIVPVLTLQVFTSTIFEHMEKNGGNALGLDQSEGPVLVVLVNVMWDNEADDKGIIKAISEMMDKITAEANASNKFNEYIYMNYASQFQSVVESYGAANHERLVQIARKYDPHEVFQKLQPGYFKLNGAPSPTPPR